MRSRPVVSAVMALAVVAACALHAHAVTCWLPAPASYINDPTFAGPFPANKCNPHCVNTSCVSATHKFNIDCRAKNAAEACTYCVVSMVQGDDGHGGWLAPIDYNIDTSIVNCTINSGVITKVQYLCLPATVRFKITNFLFDVACASVTGNTLSVDWGYGIILVPSPICCP